MEASIEGVGGGSTYNDATQFGWTSATVANAASYSASGILYAVKGFIPQSHRVKIVTAGGNNDADFTISIKKVPIS